MILNETKSLPLILSLAHEYNTYCLREMWIFLVVVYKRSSAVHHYSLKPNISG